MLVRSYVTPVQRLTGDCITSIEIGHRKRLGTVMYNFSLIFAILAFNSNAFVFSSASFSLVSHTQHNTEHKKIKEILLYTHLTQSVVHLNGCVVFGQTFVSNNSGTLTGKI